MTTPWNRSALTMAAAGVALPLMLCLAACSASPAEPGPAASGSAAKAHAKASRPRQVVPASDVRVPRYVAAKNVRDQVRAGSCRADGAKGWRLQGTVTNASRQRHGYSIVVDFVTTKGDTVLATKIANVRRLAPGKSARWSVTGAAGQSHVSCVIRQALSHA